MTIWRYRKISGNFIKENWAIELEVNGQRLKKRWPKNKQNIAASNPDRWVLIGLLIAILPFLHICKKTIIFEQIPKELARRLAS